MYMLRLLTILLVVLAGSSGCTSRLSTLPPIDSVESQAYRLDSGDRVRLVVFGLPELSGEYGVNDQGMISMPLLQPIAARGVTPNDLETSIEQALQRDLLVEPSVSAEIIQYRPFYILGEVLRPGQYPFVSGMTTLTAVAIGGGFTFRANTDEFQVLRQVDGRVIEGRAGTLALVQPGDTIVVVERLF